VGIEKHFIRINPANAAAKPIWVGRASPQAAGLTQPEYGGTAEDNGLHLRRSNA